MPTPKSPSLKNEPATPPEVLFADALEKLVGVAPDRVEFPGGKNRKTAVAVCGDEKWVISRRSSRERAGLEAGVLAELGRFDGPVPQLIAHEGTWIIQEYLAGQRLSEALAEAPDKTWHADGIGPARDWLHRAVASLSVVHEAGRRAGLERRVIAIGARPGWIDQLIGVPGQIGRQIGITAPDLAADRLRAALAVANPQLIKWDARPGNAMATSTETGTKEVMWFDWEHCGCRDPLDDLAWLLGDEWAPENESVETEILDRHIGDFAGRRGRDEARAYLMIFGTFHMAVRLSLILEHKGNGAWWDRDYCLTHDKIGITPEGVRRTCRRAARWSAADPLTAPLSHWFQQAEEHILAANPDSGADTRPRSGT